MIFGLYGISGLIAGLYGYANPCNRYALADVTWCGPAPDLGVFRFNLSYTDAFEERHEGSIVSSSIACASGSVGQHVELCYRLSDPADFRNGTVGFEDPAVAPGLVFSAIPALVLSVVACCMSKHCWECFLRQSRRDSRMDCADAMPLVAIGVLASTSTSGSHGPSWTPC